MGGVRCGGGERKQEVESGDATAEMCEKLLHVSTNIISHRVTYVVTTV